MTGVISLSSVICCTYCASAAAAVIVVEDRLVRITGVSVYSNKSEVENNYCVSVPC